MFGFLATHSVVQLLDPVKLRTLLHDGVLACNPTYFKYLHDRGFAQSLKACFTTGLQFAKVSKRLELMATRLDIVFRYMGDINQLKDHSCSYEPCQDSEARFNRLLLRRHANPNLENSRWMRHTLGRAIVHRHKKVNFSLGQGKLGQWSLSRQTTKGCICLWKYYGKHPRGPANDEKNWITFTGVRNILCQGLRFWIFTDSCGIKSLLFCSFLVCHGLET